VISTLLNRFLFISCVVKETIVTLFLLIDSLTNNKDSLSLNLLIDLILEQFTKILYRDFHNQDELCILNE